MLEGWKNKTLEPWRRDKEKGSGFGKAKLQDIVPGFEGFGCFLVLDFKQMNAGN